MSIFDLKTALADEGVDMTIRHPVTGEAVIGQTIKLLGTDSRAYREHLLRKKRAVSEHYNATHTAPKIVVEQTEQNALEELLVLTVGWSRTDDNGEPIPFSKEAAAEIYKDPYRSWLRDQVEAFVKDHGNFLSK